MQQIDLFTRTPSRADLRNDDTRMDFWLSLPIRYDDHPASRKATQRYVFRRQSYLPDRTLGGVASYEVIREA